MKATEQRIAGLLLQVLPGRTIDVDVFEAAAAAARTISLANLTGVDARELLPKVFAHHVIRLFQPRPVLHDCRCTPERLAGVITPCSARTKSRRCSPSGPVSHVQFCNRAFRYDESR